MRHQSNKALCHYTKNLAALLFGSEVFKYVLVEKTLRCALKGTISFTLHSEAQF